MAKDEKIWIPDNYYQGFLRGCLANERIEETPSKTALENAGCEISGMCYLILPDGSQHNPRTMKPNEFPTSIRKLFESIPNAGESEEIPAVLDTVGQELNDVLQEATYQVCDTCHENKPLEAFKKRPGRGVLRKSTCIECEIKAKASGPEPEQETTAMPMENEPVIVKGPIKDPEVIITKKNVIVSLEYLKNMATEAFERGREFERSNIVEVQPSLDELLDIGA